MPPRKIFKLGRSLAVTLPAELCHVFGYEKGAILHAEQIKGLGILMVRDEFPASLPPPEARLRSMRDCADDILADLRRKARRIEISTIYNIFEQMICSLSRDALIRLPDSKAGKEWLKTHTMSQAIKEIHAKLDKIKKEHDEILRSEGYYYDPQRALPPPPGRRKKGEAAKEARI